MNEKLKLIEEKMEEFQNGNPVRLTGDEIDLFMRNAAFVERTSVVKCIEETDTSEKIKQLALGMLDSIPSGMIVDDGMAFKGLVCCYSLGLTMSMFLAEFQDPDSEIREGLMRIRFRITNTDLVPIVKTRDGFDPQKMMSAVITLDEGYDPS